MNRKLWLLALGSGIFAGSLLLTVLLSTRYTQPVLAQQGLPAVAPLAQPPSERIVYLTDASSSADLLTTSERLQATLGAITTST